jgi:hypothetical protein
MNESYGEMVPLSVVNSKRVCCQFRKIFCIVLGIQPNWWRKLG